MTRDSTLERSLYRAIAQAAPCRVVYDSSHSTPQQLVDDDLASALALGPAERLLRVWANSKCVVASRRQGALASFAFAKARSEGSGWPVAVRRSGGTAVVHRPGILNFSLIVTSPLSDPMSVTNEYRQLLALLRSTLAGLNIAADQGEVPGAHCDGLFNLCWGGRKLAGTAGFVSRSSGRSIKVFHASLHVHGEVSEDLRAIQAFEHALGQSIPYDADAHVSVEEIIAGTATSYST